MKTNRKNIIAIVISFAFFVISLILCIYYKGTMSEYSSVLDKYLNLSSITLINVFTILNLIFAIIGIVLFIVLLIKRNNNIKKSKTALIIFIVLFVLSNLYGFITLVNNEMNKETTVDTIPETVNSYVDFKDIFDEPNYEFYHEQTNFNKIAESIPVNYEVQQTDDENSVQTACVQITDKSLLSNYYDELKKLYGDYSTIDFTNDEIKSLNITKGFYYTIDKSTIAIIVIKDDKLFNVSIDGEYELNQLITQQIASL